MTSSTSADVAKFNRDEARAIGAERRPRAELDTGPADHVVGFHSELSPRASIQAR